MQTMEITVTIHRDVCVKSGRARRRAKLRKRLARLNPLTVAWYAALTMAGVLLYKLGAAYALQERGYYAIGGEALALLLPVMYYAVAETVRGYVKDWRAQ